MNDEQHEEKKEDTEIKRVKSTKPENNTENYPNQKEEEIGKNKEILTLKMLSERHEKKQLENCWERRQ